MSTVGEDAFKEATGIAVGFSDKVLLLASIIGFIVLAWTIYSVVLLRTKTAAELQEDELKEAAENYEALLVKADVATLNRAQRRARARAVKKQLLHNKNTAEQGEVADNGDQQPLDEDESNTNNDNNDRNALKLTRKERQQAAKAAERLERKLSEAHRLEKQKQAQEHAKKEKLKREAAAQKERVTKEQEAIEKELRKQEAWSTFLSTPTRSLSVDEWIASLQEDRIVAIADLAVSFSASPDVVYNRIKELIAERRVAGVLDKNTFISLTENELQELAKAIIQKGSVTIEQVATLCNQMIQSKS